MRKGILTLAMGLTFACTAASAEVIERCENTKESCHSSSFEISCMSEDDMRFICYRDEAIKRKDASLCAYAKGTQGGGLSLEAECYTQLARKFADISLCEKVKQRDPDISRAYLSCRYSVHEKTGKFSLSDCVQLKKDQTYFTDCIGKLAAQEKTPSLCAQHIPSSWRYGYQKQSYLKRCKEFAVPGK